ncbi:glycerophosphodiester phosphodiesterase family protein [Paucisalibacillus sp. EB02]|uniref:glycerophosphodiester phosphodiesterase family protein n=1 Tax=Paucisalibacillus sp. EB02 TaxID=1347087 RepID=UPI0004BAF38F|nr:glycerophosphodiester phosphodiesterase family protein [Paucisalibacillus sp. EB02]
MKKKILWFLPILAVTILCISLFNIKSATASEEILVDENFEQGVLPDGWEIIEGNARVQDGALELTSPSTSNPSRVIFPTPDGLGDYTFEADVTFKTAVNDARWASLMYRIQGEDYPYYQFAVRKGTSALNGLEFAIRTASNTWSVPMKTFYPEDFGYNETYRLKVIAKGERVQQFVNGQLVIDTDLADTYLDGDLGFQVSGATVEFDNVLVTTRTNDLPPLEDSNAFLPIEPETNMINAPTIISSSIPGDFELQQGVSSVLLQTELNESGNIYVGESLLNDALSATRGKVIPIIQVEEEEAVDGIINALENASLKDVHILSSNLDILTQIKDAYPAARGAILYNNNHLNKHDLKQLVEDANRNSSFTIVLPENLVSVDTVHYFHARAISVWGIGENTHSLIHAGVDGIVTGNPTEVVAAFGQYPENTIVQRPLVVAHRGVPSLAPENTMTGYHLSYELGADLIETDVQLTKDGYLVVMHDYTVNRTTNGTGAVADLTLEEIRALDAGIKFGEEFVGEKVPTFREFLEGFKDKDVVLLVELKATGIEEQVLEEIMEVGVEEQVVLQSFNMESVKKYREIAPQISVGYLYSASVPGSSEQRIKDAEQMLNYATTIGARLNASYGSLSEESITYMRQRGLLNMHWTFRSQEPFEDLLKKGLIGPITDYTQWLTDGPTLIDTPIKKRNLKVGKSATIQAKTFVNYRVDKSENIETTLFVSGNQESVDVNGNTITAIAPGEANVFAVHTFTMLNSQWNLVSEPIKVMVSE